MFLASCGLLRQMSPVGRQLLAALAGHGGASAAPALVAMGAVFLALLLAPGPSAAQEEIDDEASNKFVRLTLLTPVQIGRVVFVSYTVPPVNPLRNIARGWRCWLRGGRS